MLHKRGDGLMAAAMRGRSSGRSRPEAILPTVEGDSPSCRPISFLLSVPSPSNLTSRSSSYFLIFMVVLFPGLGLSRGVRAAEPSVALRVLVLHKG